MTNAMLALSQAASKSADGLVRLSLLQKGLVTTLVGLVGVFLVLTLFYGTIKLMQHLKTKDEKQQ